MKLLGLVLASCMVTNAFGQTTDSTKSEPLTVVVTIDDCTSSYDTLTHREVYRYNHFDAGGRAGPLKVGQELAKRIKYRHAENYPGLRIQVAFVIDEDGKFTGARIITGSALGKQVLDILDDFNWVPGTCDGKKVASLHVFPLRIEIQD